MSWLAIAGIYLAGFVAVQVLTWASLRSELTAHGHIVGQQLGCIAGLFWPLVLAWLLVVGTFASIYWLARNPWGWRR